MSLVVSKIVYQVPTQHAVRLQLAKDDARALDKDEQSMLHDEITPSILVGAGLDL